MPISTMLRSIAFIGFMFSAMAGFTQLTAWSYKAPLLLKNEDGVDRTNYVFKFIFDTQSIVSAGNLDISGKDLRFASDCNGNKLLNFWVEKGFNTPSTTLWIFLDSLDAGQQRTIYLFGKNAAALSKSNFDSTFVSQLIVDSTNVEFQVIQDSIWKYNYIEVKRGVNCALPPTLPLGTAKKLTLDASRIVISGSLTGDGAGHPGVAAGKGQGPGGGGAAPSTGGGGAGHAGVGGRGGYNAPSIGNAGIGGVVYGSGSARISQPGSGGGASGAVGGAKPGGPGGGAFALIAEDITVSGKITVVGGDGLGGGTLAYCSGAGSAGTILLNARDLNLTGELKAKGGIGGASELSGYTGGGGGGGYIKYFYLSTYTNTAFTEVEGGAGGGGNCCVAPEYGSDGVKYSEQYSLGKASLTAITAPALVPDLALPVCEGSSLSLSAPSGFSSYEFYKNNVLTSSGASSSFILTANNGDKIVARLFTGGGCFISTDTLIISTNPLPTISLNASPENLICNSEVFNLVGASPTATTYQWKFNGSAIAGETSPTVTVADSGNYQVIFSDANLCTNSSSVVHFSMADKPIVTAPSGTLTICDQDSLLVTAAANIPVTFEWFFNGSSVENQASIQLKSAGAYYCEATSVLNCKTQTLPINLVLNALPDPKVDTSFAGGTLCGNATLKITADPGFQSYMWYLNGVAVPGTIDSLDITAEGVYSVQVSDLNSCTNTSQGVFINRFGPFESVSGGNVNTCAGDSVLIGNPLADGYVIDWTLNGSSIPVTSGSFYTQQSGAYVLTVSNGFSCELTSTVNVNTIPLPTGTLNTTSDSSFCEGTPYTLSVNTAATFITWFNSATPIAQNIGSISPSTSGTYYAVLLENGCSSATPIIDVTVLPVPPTPQFTLQFDSLVSSSPTDNQWLLNGNPIPGATGQVYHITQNGIYSLMAIGTNGCESDTSSALNFQNTGITAQNQIAYKVYPNPVSEKFNVQIDGTFTYSLFDNTGRLLFTSGATNSSEIDISAMQNGIYQLVLNKDGRISSERIVKLQ